MFASANAFNQLLPTAFDTSNVETVRVFVSESNLMRNQILIPFSNPTCYKMELMFYAATVFNQPLPFNTAKVTSVRVFALSLT